MEDVRPDESAIAADVPAPDELGALCLRLARSAADVVRDGRAAGVDVDSKSTATDLVTDVDRRTERFLVGELARLRPGDAVLGEEGGESGADGSARVRWLLDPIDGTVNFVLGIPQYAVSVAAEVDGTVVAGAVCNPATGETYRAVRGRGAFLDDLALDGPRGVPLARAVVGTGFGYDAARRARQVEVVARLLPQVADIRRLGSAALDLCFLAAGRLDGYFEANLNPWDFAAGALIAAEAGCTVRVTPAPDRRTSFVAGAGGSLAGDLFALLRETGAEAVTGP